MPVFHTSPMPSAEHHSPSGGDVFSAAEERYWLHLACLPVSNREEAAMFANRLSVAVGAYAHFPHNQQRFDRIMQSMRYLLRHGTRGKCLDIPTRKYILCLVGTIRFCIEKRFEQAIQPHLQLVQLVHQLQRVREEIKMTSTAVH